MSLPRRAAQGGLARAVCRVYAVSPCVITVLLAAAFAASERGVAAAALATAGVLGLMAALFPTFRAQPGRLLLNGALFFTLAALPAAVVPWRGLRGALLGALLEVVLDAALLLALPRLGARVQRLVQPELLPDVFTGLLLAAGFAPWLRLARRTTPLPLPAPPWDVAVLVCAHDERATIHECLTSIRTAMRAAADSPLARSLQLVLVDSDPGDGTRLAAGGLPDRVLAGAPGKLSARHQATLASAAQVIVAADGDRAYGEAFLCALLAALARPGAVASMGETANQGSGPSGSALSRRLLALPMNAGNSAYFRSAYLEVPFDTTVNQFRHAEIWPEEEFLFSLRLRDLGRIEHAEGAKSFELRPYPVIDQLRRHLFGLRLRTF